MDLTWIFQRQGCCCCQQQWFGSGDQPCPQKWVYNYPLKPNIVNTKFQHHTPFVIPTKLTLKLSVIHSLIPLCNWQRSLPIFPPFSNKHNALQRITRHLRNLYAKHVHVTFTAISPGFIFVLCYQHRFIELMCLRTVRILLPYRITWVNEPWNKNRKTPLPKNIFFGVVSTLWYHTFSTLSYWGRCTKFKFENVIVYTMSTNICPLCDTCFYVNWRTTFKCINIFVGMVTHFKIIHNDPVLVPLSFLLASVTISLEIPKWHMLLLKI